MIDQCLFAVQPINFISMVRRALKTERTEELFEVDIDARLQNNFGFSLSEMGPDAFIKDIKIPVMYSQCRGDMMASATDVKTMHENTQVSYDKKIMHWIDGPKPFGQEGEYKTRFDGF